VQQFVCLFSIYTLQAVVQLPGEQQFCIDIVGQDPTFNIIDKIYPNKSWIEANLDWEEQFVLQLQGVIR